MTKSFKTKVNFINKVKNSITYDLLYQGSANIE